MLNLYDEAKDYIEYLLGVAVHVEPVTLKVPFHLREIYTFVELSFQFGMSTSVTLLLLVPHEDDYPGAVTLTKHIAQVRKATDAVLVYVCKSLSPQERRSLIMHHINFIQPAYQMFLPELAMDLREGVRKRRTTKEISALLPATQAMLLGRLYEGWSRDDFFTANAILGVLKYSRVTLAKAVDQLLELSVLFPVTTDLPWKAYAFKAPPAEVFRKVRPYLRSPVRRKVAITTEWLFSGGGAFVAGESALAKYTMLAEPDQPVYGMTKQAFDEMLARNEFKVTQSVDEIRAWVEIWAYPSVNDLFLADPVSLLLSLEDNPDERVQIALDELKELVTWLGSEV